MLDILHYNRIFTLTQNLCGLLKIACVHIMQTSIIYCVCKGRKVFFLSFYRCLGIKKEIKVNALQKKIEWKKSKILKKVFFFCVKK